MVCISGAIEVAAPDAELAADTRVVAHLGGPLPRKPESGVLTIGPLILESDYNHAAQVSGSETVVVWQQAVGTRYWCSHGTRATLRLRRERT